MATTTYKTVLDMAASLSREEQMRLVHELTARSSTESPRRRRSILELEGLGKEIWQGIDAQEYINNERSSWNG